MGPAPTDDDPIGVYRQATRSYPVPNRGRIGIQAGSRSDVEDKAFLGDAGGQRCKPAHRFPASMVGIRARYGNEPTAIAGIDSVSHAGVHGLDH